MTTKAKAPEVPAERITIRPPEFRILHARLIGTAPLMQARFSAKAMQAMRAKMVAGNTARGKKQREARDFQSDFEQAMHIATEGWTGVPCAALRNACIDVGRVIGFKMTVLRQAVFFEADGLDRQDGMPLVRLDADDPEVTELAVRNATGVADIRVRPLWREWALNVRCRFDSELLSAQDVANLLLRAGLQVGIGEGRPYSKSSNGMGLGTFTLDMGLTETTP